MNSTRDFYESEHCDWLPKRHYFRNTGDIFENSVFEKGGFFEPDALILDDGCGDGRLIEKMHNNQTIVGIDISSRQLAIAKKRLPGDVHLIKASVTHLPFKDQAFDHILSWSVLIHVERSEDRLKALGEIARIQKNNGSALILLKNYPSMVYHIGSFVHRLLWSKKIHNPFVKENYQKVEWADASLYLYRSTYFEMKKSFHGLGMKIDWIKAQGCLLPDEFDVITDGIMAHKKWGVFLGTLDRLFSRVVPIISDYVAYNVSKK